MSRLTCKVWGIQSMRGACVSRHPVDCVKHHHPHFYCYHHYNQRHHHYHHQHHQHRNTMCTQDRDRYVSGDYRFRNGYCKSNPRKMVQVSGPFLMPEEEQKGDALHSCVGHQCKDVDCTVRACMELWRGCALTV